MRSREAELSVVSACLQGCWRYASARCCLQDLALIYVTELALDQAARYLPCPVEAPAPHYPLSLADDNTCCITQSKWAWVGLQALPEVTEVEVNGDGWWRPAGADMPWQSTTVDTAPLTMPRVKIKPDPEPPSDGEIILPAGLLRAPVHHHDHCALIHAVCPSVYWRLFQMAQLL